MHELENPFEAPLEAFLLWLNRLNGLLWFLNWQLVDFRAMYKDSLQKRGIGLEEVKGGTSLVIRDLSEWPDHGWAEYYSSGLFIIEGEGYLNLVDGFVQRESAWTISQAYEAFESYLKDIAALHLFKRPDLAPQRQLERFRRRQPRFSLDHQEFWRIFVSRENAFDVLDTLRLSAPFLAETEEHNNRALDLRAWLSVLAEVRHGVVHASCVIRQTRATSWSAERFKILESHFKSRLADQGYLIQCGPNEAQNILSITGEYGYLVYKALSQAAGYPCQPPLNLFGNVSPNTSAAPDV